MNPYNPEHYQTYVNTYGPYPSPVADPDPAIETFDPWEEHPHNTTGQPKRVPGSPQLRLYYESQYRGWSVSQQAHYGGLIENYLKRTWEVIDAALTEYPRVYAVRVDLRYPQCYPAELSRDNHCMKQFFYYLQWELDRANHKYPTRVHYVWAREQSRSPNPHYHLLLLFNRDAINYMGWPQSSDEGGYHRNNLFHSIVRAWAYALGLANDPGINGLVEYGKKSQYDRDDPYGGDEHCSQRGHTGHSTGEYRVSCKPADGYELARLHYRASYLCKAYSKRFGEGTHCFGSSRRRRC